jgi:hypothetical protein
MMADTRLVCGEAPIARLSTIGSSHLSVLLYNCDKGDFPERRLTAASWSELRKRRR